MEKINQNIRAIFGGVHMRIINPFQMNDWDIKKFLIIVLAVQIGMLGVIALDIIGFEMLILRQLISFIYLTLIPGFLFLRILKIHQLGNIPTLLYAVGLSIATLMFIGLFMNIIYPLFGISKPISIMDLIITITIFVLTLCILAYIRDKNYSNPSFINIREILSPLSLFLLLIPILSIFGTYLMNFYGNNLLLMFLIIIVSLIPPLIAFTFIPIYLYPLAVFVIAISLLYHNSLISMHICGWDIHLEYYFSKLVIENSYWNSTLYGNINGMLAIVILAPIYSILLDISLTWVFKIIYPLLFSLVPLGLYYIYRYQTNDKIAFLSCFFFMALSTFYTEMLALARQQIAMLYFILLIMVIIDDNIRKAHKYILFIIFGASLVVSHYGTAYLFMFLLIGVWLLSYSRRVKVINSIFVIFFITFVLTWYMYTAGSHPFNTIVEVGNYVINTIYTSFLNPRASEALMLMLKNPISIFHYITKILHHITQFFITVGIISMIFIKNYKNKFNFNIEYLEFSFLFFVGYFIILSFPYTGFGTTRLYLLSLIFLAPFCIIGGMLITKILLKILSKFRENYWIAISEKLWPKVMSIFFMIFLLFNSGWVYEVTKDYPNSIALNNTIDYPRFNSQEILAAKWLHIVKTNSPTYADAFRWLLLIEFEGYPYGWYVNFNKIQTFKKDVYVYLGTFNVKEGKVLTERRDGVIRIKEYIDITNLINEKNKIYDNSGSQIYR